MSDLHRNICTFRFHFSRAALNAGRSSHQKAVCPFVCPSVKRVHSNKTEERYVQIFIP